MSRLSNRLLNLACRKTNWRYNRLSTFHHCRQEATQNYSQDQKAFTVNNDSPNFSAESGKPFPPHTSVLNKSPIGSPEHKQNLLDHRLWLIENDIRRFNRVDPHSFNEYCNILKTTRTVSSTAVLTLINACGTYMHMVPSAKRIEMLEDLWTTLKNIGFTPDISHYNNLLSAYLENHHDFFPIDFLTRLEKRKIEPNRITFQRLLHRFAQLSDLNGVRTILEYMRGLDLAVTEQVCNSLLYANVKAKNEPELQAVIQFMTKNNMDLTSDSYFQILCGHAENNNLPAVEKVIDDNSHIVFSDKQILHLIYLFARNNNHSATDVLLKRIRKTPGYIHEGINAALRVNSLGAIEPAVSILFTVQNESSTIGNESGGAGGPLLNQAVDLNFTDQQIVQFCDILKEKGVNSRPYELAYTVACQASRKALAMQMMQRMVDDNQPPLAGRQNCFWPLVLMTARDGDGCGLSTVADLAHQANATLDIQTLTEWAWPAYLAKINSDGRALSMSVNLDDHLNIISEMRRLLRGSLGGSDNLVSAAYIINHMLAGNVPVVKVLMEHFNADIHLTIYSVEKFAIYIRNTNDTATVFKRLANFIKESFVPLNHRQWIVNDFVYVLLRNLRSEQFAHLVDNLYEYKIPITAKTQSYLVHFLESKRSLAVDVKKLDELAELHHTAYTAEDINRTSTYARSLNTPIYEVVPSNFSDFVSTADRAHLNESVRHMLRTDFKKGVKLMKLLSGSAKVPPASTYFFALKLCLENNDIDSAVEFQHKGYDVKPNFFVAEPFGQLQLLMELLDRDRIDDVVKCAHRWTESLSLVNQKRAGYHDDSNANRQETEYSKSFVATVSPNFMSLAENFITALFQRLFDPKTGAAQLNQAVVLQICEGLLAAEATGITHSMFSNALKYLLDKNHVDFARDVFEIVLRKCGRAVCLTDMLRALVAANQVDKLQQTYNLLTSKLGEGYATLHLALALVACNKPREAVKLVSVSSIRISKGMYEKEIKWALTRNDDATLLAVLTCLPSSFVSLRELAYKNLLLIYRIRSDFDGAKELYLRMQEENYAPSSEIQQLLDGLNQRQTTRFPKQSPPSISASTLLNLLKGSGVSNEASSTNKTQRTTEALEPESEQPEVPADEPTLNQQHDAAVSH